MAARPYLFLFSSTEYLTQSRCSIHSYWLDGWVGGWMSGGGEGGWGQRGTGVKVDWVAHLNSTAHPYLIPYQEARSSENSTPRYGVFLCSFPNIWTSIIGHCVEPHSSSVGTPLWCPCCPSEGLCPHQANFPSFFLALTTFPLTHLLRGSHSSSSFCPLSAPPPSSTLTSFMGPLLISVLWEPAAAVAHSLAFVLQTASCFSCACLFS